MIFFALFASLRFQSCLFEQIVSIVGFAQDSKEFLEVGGQRRFELDLFLGHGMLEGEAPGVECLAPKAAARRLGTRISDVSPLTTGIERVTDNGVAGVGHVNADLVRATGDGAATDERRAGKELFDLVEGAGWAALTDYGHLLAVARVAAYWRIDGAVGCLRRPVAHGEVGLADRVLAKGDRQREVGAVGFGNHHDPGRVLVQAVNDTGALDPSDPRQIVTVVEEGVDECT